MVEIDNKRTVFEKAKFTTNNNPNSYLWQLDIEDYQAIKIALASSLMTYNEINPNSEEFMQAMTEGMSGRLCDLEDTIEIEYIK